jgi:predicted nucleic acid-binding protein
MDLVVVDTDVLSFIFKHDSRGAADKPHLDAYRKPFTVFHSDESLCLSWAQVMEDSRRKGRPIQTADAWIAATALLHNIPIVTNNRKHFDGVIGLTVISEDNP